jgi:signal transduction histidine kinase
MSVTEKDMTLEQPLSIEMVDELNNSAWETKVADARHALSLAQQALSAAEAMDYKKGQAYALRNVAGCHWLLSEYQDALEEAQDSLLLFEELNDAFGLAHAMNLLGNVNEKIGEHTKALDYHLKSLNIREEIGDNEGRATSLNNIGNVYFNFGRHADALDCYLKSLFFYEETGNHAGISRALNNMGSIYIRLGEHQKALEALTRALLIKHEIGDKLNEGKVLHNIGDVYAARGSYKKALEYFAKSLENSRAFGDKLTEVASLGSIGEVYQKINDYDQALDYHTRCLDAARAIGVKYSEIEALINLSATLIKRKDLDEALKYLDQALLLVDELRANELTHKIHLALSEAYEAKGDLSLALRHHKLFHQSLRRIFGEETEQKVKSLSVQFEIEKARQEAEIHRFKNVELAHANEALTEANQVKTELLHIAAHDLKNPLQAVLGFADLIMQEAGPGSSIEEMAREIFDSSQRMFALIKAILEQDSLESGKIELNKRLVAVETLARESVNHNQPQALQKNQTISLEVDEGCFTQADPKLLVEAFDNLISNAVKYSLQDKPIKVNVRNNGNTILFSVKDEGPGLTDEDKRKLFHKFQRLSAQPTGGESATRVGLAIAKLLVESHDGRIWAESEYGKGSAFFIEIPVIVEKESEEVEKSEDLDNTAT